MLQVVHHCSDYADLIHSGTTFASFLILGFLEIGQEMCVIVPPLTRFFLTPCSENPFSYDENDLGELVPRCTAKRLFTTC